MDVRSPVKQKGNIYEWMDYCKPCGQVDWGFSLRYAFISVAGAMIEQTRRRTDAFQNRNAECDP